MNSFTSEDIQKSAKWAHKFYQELGTKSPFFRAWFGDYRSADKSETKIADIPEYVASNESRKANRGNVVNADTGWDIRISREGETNTISHAGDMRLSEYGLSGIRGLIENAVLLDSEVHEHHSNNAKNDLIAFDHKLYALGKASNGNVSLYKITVEEKYQDPYNTNEKRFHNLKYIEKVAEASADANVEQSHKDGSTMRSSTTNYNVSQLYSFVKRFDKDFNAGKAVNPAMLNDDGTPKVVYHGTRESFTTFELQSDPKFGRALGNGFYFTSDYSKAHQYANGRFSKGQDRGGIVMPVYLDMKRPYIIKADADRTKWHHEYAKGGYDGIIDERYNTYFVENSTQIKSATDNIGTFDRENPDIRYSKRNSTKEEDAGAYTYEALTGKPDMHITELSGTVPNNRADVVYYAKRNASKIGKFNAKDASVSVHVDDIDADVVLSTNGLKHGLDRRFEANAAVTLNAGEIIRNSIRINELTPQHKEADKAYVLIGAATDDAGSLYLVRSVVNTFSNELVSMDVLYAINAKKENRLRSMRPGIQPPVTDSTISIAELLEHVNKNFPDVLPESVLRHFGYTERPEGNLGENALFSKRNPDSLSDREVLVNALETTAQNESEKNALNQYRESIGTLEELEDHLIEVKEEIKRLSFAKGKRDTAKLRALNDEKIKTQNRISNYDGRLLRFEAAKPIRDFVARQRELLKKRYRQKGRELLRENAAERTETINKKVARDRLQKTVSDTERWLTSPSKADVKCPDILKEPYMNFIASIDK